MSATARQDLKRNPTHWRGKFLLCLIAGWMMAGVASAQTGSIVTVNADNVLVINGQKKFIIGFSPGPPNNTTTPTGADALQELRNAGGLLFKITQTNSWNSQLIAYQQTALDWAAQHGMYCWINLAELSEFPVTATNTAASLRSTVDTFRNHPALGLWKNYDEAWWGGISVSNLLDGYEVIKQEDTNHPVVQTDAPRGTVADLQPYDAAADILAVDIYPVAIPPPTNPPPTNTNISVVGDWTTILQQVVSGKQECWTIEQIAFSGTTPPTHTLVFPTFAQSRYMAYQALIDGARGLMFFGGNITATLSAQDVPYGWNWTFWTNVLKPVVQQLGDHGVLATALVQPNSTLPITMSGTTSPDIEFCVREVPPYLFILASKREGATVNVTFSGLPSWAGAGEVLFESPRMVTAQNGQFSDQFAPFDVHVYRFSETDVPPTILFPPQSQTNVTGSTASFSVMADGTGPLTYQWRKNLQNLSDGGNVSGSSTPNLTLANVSSADAGSYDVMVTGSGTIDAPPATLTVLSNGPPVITAEPQSVTNVAGATVTFSVSAGGVLPLTYQWVKNSANLSDGGNVSGSSGPVLTLTGVTAADAANYYAVVTNSLGSQPSYAAKLTVLYPLPYYEPFNYPVGVNLGGQTNPNYLLWSDIGTSTGGPYITVQSNNLSVAGLIPSSGNQVQFGGLGVSERLSLPAANFVKGGTFYYSFALQVPSISGLSSSGVFVAGFNNSIGTQTGQPTVVGTRLYLRSTSGGYNAGVSKNSSTTTDWVWDPRTFTTNQTLFIVGSYTFNTNSTSDDVSKMWINPAATNFSASAEPSNALIATNGPDITGTGIESFVLLQRSTSEPPVMLADELRLGPTWVSVTPIPPPVLTNVKVLAKGVIQFSYSNSSGPGFIVYASTNLVDWISLGPATQVSPGNYQFTDTGATNLPRRFYQLRQP